MPAAQLDTGVNPAVFEIAGHMVLKRAQVRACVCGVGGRGWFIGAADSALWCSSESCVMYDCVRAAELMCTHAHMDTRARTHARTNAGL